MGGYDGEGKSGEAMSITTRDKLAFALAMGRHTRADVRQVQQLLRYAGTLRAIANAHSDPALMERTLKRERIRKRVTDLCNEIHGPVMPEPQSHELPTCRACGEEWLPNHVCLAQELRMRGCVPLFQPYDLKIRVPSGAEVEVPS